MEVNIHLVSYIVYIYDAVGVGFRQFFCITKFMGGGGEFGADLNLYFSYIAALYSHI